ncbi:USP7 [Branchiostoma lanceolatum]|uniref:USP7 protein n=1 Tax=Branchiostoma lanceolatum TaxID=7740 RepID=A0A8K0EH04_BRALA|nr:USP7 [Branchiostoma lanceolatum]
MEGLKPKEETKDDSLLSKISGDFLECTICLEPFKDPKVLPCLHTFCEDCLKKFVAQDKVKNKFLCPTCRTETVLPKGGVASLNNNFFVQSLSDTVQAHKSLVSKEDDKVPCDNCEEEGASHGCVVCEEFLCDDCACAHRRGKRTRSHEVIGAAEFKEQMITKTETLKSKSLPICPKHDDEKMKFYCETCKHPICRDCTVLQHKNHKYGYLVDAVVDVRAKIKDKLKVARQKMTKYQDKASAVAKKQAELDTSRKKAADDINAAAEEEIKYLTSLVKRRQTELKEKLAAITADRSKQLSATADSVESTLGCLSSTVDFSQKVVEHGSDFDVMNVYSDVTERLESLLKGPVPHIPGDISHVLFDPKTRQKEKVVVLGNIVDEETQDDEMETEEESRAEATFRFTVDNFNKLDEEKISPARFIRNLPWKILIQPEHNANKKSLSVYLQCDADSNSLWSCSASAELRLIPQKNGVQTYTRKFEHIFYSKENDWGFAEFMPWQVVCDPQKGYIKDNKIILEAYVRADAPCGEKETIVGNSDDEDLLKGETEEEEQLQTEATFRFKVENVSKLNEEKFSPAVVIRNLPWKIVAKPEHNANNKSLAFYLQCDADSKRLWSCRASAELRLIPQKNGVQTYTRKFEHIFYSKENDWGFAEFMPWHEVCDPQKGYIKNNTIVLEAYVRADAPRGMKEIILGNIFVEEILKKKMEEEEELQTEATIRFTVENFSKVKESKFSPAVFICNLPWKILAKPEHNANNKSLGFYLQCDADSKSLWSCSASAELRLIPQKNGVQTYTRNLRHLFHSDEGNWGFSEFMPWHEVCDPQRGYIKDGKIILEAHVKSGAPYITA